MAHRVYTPLVLEAMGYVVYFGDDSDPPELQGKHWWTWSNGASGDASRQEWASAQEAVNDAYQNAFNNYPTTTY